MSDDPSETPTAIVDRTGCVVADVACIRCGYNLRGMLIEGPCPGCGLRVSHVVRKTFDRERRLRAEIACLKCGYNLRSLLMDGRCPECGLPVEESVRGDLLQFASPGWVRKLERGARLLLISDICVLVATVGATCLWLAIQLSSPPGGGLADPAVTCLLTVFAISAMGAALAAVAGLLLITAPEPRVGVKPKGVHVRRLCRYSLGVTLLAAAVAVLSWSAMFSPVSSSWAGDVAALTALFFGLGVLPLSTLRHLRNLLRRVPHPDTDKLAVMITAGVWIADVMLAALVIGTRVWSSSIVVIICAPSAGLAGVWTYILSLPMFHQARRSFRQAADKAAANAGES